MKEKSDSTRQAQDVVRRPGVAALAEAMMRGDKRLSRADAIVRAKHVYTERHTGTSRGKP